VTVNVVVLAGTVAADPVERRMPSGDEVHRAPTARPCPLVAIVPSQRGEDGRVDHDPRHEDRDDVQEGYVDDFHVILRLDANSDAPLHSAFPVSCPLDAIWAHHPAEVSGRINGIESSATAERR
jgi:hypothetical protein